MKNDQVFTPALIVTKMLDLVGYENESIPTKTILEPSFGDGAFLNQILERIISFSKSNHLSPEETISILNNISGIEIDKELYQKTKSALIKKCKSHGIDYMWDNLICGDSTEIIESNKYDIVVMNPPYIRTHDIEEEKREYIENNFEFCHGNTDMYVIFFELCINALKNDGVLCCISPNSFIKNSSQRAFREYLANNRLIKAIYDYGNVPVFGKVATYTAITLIDKKSKNNRTKYVMMDNMSSERWENDIDLTVFGGNPWTATSEDDETFLKIINSRKTKLSDLCTVQYGLATNADKIYLTDKKSDFEEEILRPIIKGSTLSADQSIIFPYKFDDELSKYVLIAEEELANKYPNVHTYLKSNKDVLESRDLENGAIWYQYGRSQGIQNSKNTKIVLKHIVSKEDDVCLIRQVDDSTLVYSGIFIVVKDDKDLEIVQNALRSKEFCRYVKLVGKDMSGGYKSFNAKIVKSFGIEIKEEFV